MLEALANAKLRHVKVEDIKITQYSAETTEEKREKAEQVLQDCLVDIEKWYPLVVEETFETRFIPVTKLEAVKFVDYFETRENTLLAVETKKAHLERLVQELAPLLARRCGDPCVWRRGVHQDEQPVAEGCDRDGRTAAAIA
jgi:hypothetical protein